MTATILRDGDRPTRPVIITYTRVSSEEQRDGHGPSRQIDAHCAHAKATGAVIDFDLRDIGLSAYTGEHLIRGQMGAIERAAREGRLPMGSQLWVENFDRLSRQQPLDAMGLLVTLLTSGVSVRTHVNGLIYERGTDGMQQVMQIVMASVSMGGNHGESHKKAGWLAKAWAKKRDLARTEGRPISRTAPGWIELVDGQYRVIEERVEVVRMIFRLAADGWGKRAIATRLNQDRVPVFQRGGRTASIWGDSYIQKLLTTRLVLGEYQPHQAPKAGQHQAQGAPIRGFYPAVIDEDLWHRARLASAARRSSGGRPSASRSVFRGLLKCRCSQGMTRIDKGEASRGRPVYACRAMTMGACDHETRYDQAIVDRLLAIQLHKDVDLIADASRTTAATERQRLQLVHARLAELTLERGHLVEAIRRGLEVDNDFRAVTGQITDLETERDWLQSSVAVGHREDVATAAKAVHDAVRSTDPDVRVKTAQRLRQILERVDFAGKTITLHYKQGPSSRIVSTSGYRHKPRPSPGQFVDGVRRRKDVDHQPQ